MKKLKNMFQKGAGTEMLKTKSTYCRIVFLKVK